VNLAAEGISIIFSERGPPIFVQLPSFLALATAEFSCPPTQFTLTTRSLKYGAQPSCGNLVLLAHSAAFSNRAFAVPSRGFCVMNLGCSFPLQITSYPSLIFQIR
jgi:hypothetical protein